jgi:hypothetical protein
VLLAAAARRNTRTRSLLIIDTRKYSSATPSVLKLLVDCFLVSLGGLVWATFWWSGWPCRRVSLSVLSSESDDPTTTGTRHAMETFPIGCRAVPRVESIVSLTHSDSVVTSPCTCWA